MSDLPSPKEMMDDRPWIGGEYEVLIAKAYASGRLVDRETIEPYHVRRTLHQTDYPRNRQQHDWIPDDS